jgi:hypothetical protein
MSEPLALLHQFGKTNNLTDRNQTKEGNVG